MQLGPTEQILLDGTNFKTHIFSNLRFLVKKFFGLKKFLIKKIFLIQNKILVQKKNFGPKKIFGPKTCLVQINFWMQKFLG